MARLIRRRVKGAFHCLLDNLCLGLNLCQSQWYFLGHVFPNFTLFGAYVDHQKRLYHRYFVYSWEDKNQGFSFSSLYDSGSFSFLGGSGFGLICCHPRTGMFLDILFIFGLIFTGISYHCNHSLGSLENFGTPQAFWSKHG